MTEGFVPSTVWNLAHTHAAVLLGKVNERSALYGANIHVAIALETGDRQYSQSGSGSLV
jgi:hypothetical protein